MLIAYKYGSTRKDRNATAVDVIILPYYALWLCSFINQIGTLTEVATTCRKTNENVTTAARSGNVDLIMLRSSLWRLIWLDEHLAETAVQ